MSRRSRDGWIVKNGRGSAPPLRSVFRTCTLPLPCHSEPVLTLAWESVTLRPASLCEGGGAKRRRERYAAAAPRHTGRCTPRVLVPLRSTAWASPPTYRLPKAYAYPTGRIEPSAPTPGFPAANALSKPNQRPKAATYLCRFAAKARFDNRSNPRVGVSKEGGPRPSLFGRFKERGFLRGEGNRNPSPLKWRFWLLLSLLTKVTRRRQNRKSKSPFS